MTEPPITVPPEVDAPPQPATAEQMERLIDLFEKMVNELVRNNDILGRATALDEWRAGQGRHPDD